MCKPLDTSRKLFLQSICFQNIQFYCITNLLFNGTLLNTIFLGTAIEAKASMGYILSKCVLFLKLSNQGTSRWHGD